MPAGNHLHLPDYFVPPTPDVSMRVSFVLAAVLIALSGSATCLLADDRPNIVLVMADDMGWGQTGYYDHPVLETPNLDAMAANGLRFDRFYAGCAVCSPTRASVLTGRSNSRTGVLSHGYALRRQERSIAQVLRDAGYVTGHFGKWHLNGLRGPGVPVLASDDHNPGEFGFDHWLSVTNFFDRDPLMSRRGKFEAYTGDSSEIIVDEALKFAARQTRIRQPFLAVIWYGSPHRPFVATEADKRAFEELDDASQNHYGELVAMDRSIGTLRQGLRDLNVAENTLVWFCSDNGGLPKVSPDTTGGLRGHKGMLYEGGLRVPAILEWPAAVPQARVTNFPACTMDIAPTLLDILALPADSLVQPQDGISLKPLLTQELDRREQPIPFRYGKATALIDNEFKLLLRNRSKADGELYNIQADPTESNTLADSQPENFRRMKQTLRAWNGSVDASFAGEDYPSGQVLADEPKPRHWRSLEAYQIHFPMWKERPEYRDWIRAR